MKILFTGGGTAGHVMPNLALMTPLAADGHELHYAGTAEGVERKLVAEFFPEVPYHVISAGKLRRNLSLRTLTDPWKSIAGVRQAKKLCRDTAFDCVFSKGGFVALPVILGAHRAGRATVLHESDMTPGLANKLCLRSAKIICTSFPQTAQALGGQAKFTGTPLRQELFEGLASRGKSLCGFSGNKPILLVTGGSQGARAVNECLRAALPMLLPNWDICHLCGKGNLAAELQGRQGYAQFEFVTRELPDLLAMADAVLSRAGSNTLCELLALHKPHLLIPLPKAASRGDQIDNAHACAAQGTSALLLQEDMTPETLARGIDSVHAKRGEYITAMQQAGFGQGREKVLAVIQSVMEGAL